MKALIEAFPSQIRQACEIGSKAKINPHSEEIKNILVIGLGGSAFGAEVVRNYIEPFCKVPYSICRDYQIPGWVSSSTLLIASSYSGNTEETLSALHQAMSRNPKVVVVSSGGRMLEIAREKGFDHIEVPGGYPPRSAAGFSIFQQIHILHKLGLIGDFQSDLEDALHVLDQFEDHEDARLIADQIHRRIPLLYSTPSTESAAIRWMQQIEENGKHIAFHSVIPEMNHNELVGWKNPEALLEDCVALMFKSKFDHVRNTIRMEISREIMGEYADSVIEVHAEGKTRLGELFYLLHLGDWVSLYLAEKNGEDPDPVKVIDFLKGELAKR
jgi:glucose/mannose-6-phosphate isomerase